LKKDSCAQLLICLHIDGIVFLLDRFEVRGVAESYASPVLRRFVLGWKKLGHEKRLRATIVNYADDLVICWRAGRKKHLPRCGS
jgi:hypothetical protein